MVGTGGFLSLMETTVERTVKVWRICKSLYDIKYPSVDAFEPDSPPLRHRPRRHRRADRGDRWAPVIPVGDGQAAAPGAAERALGRAIRAVASMGRGRRPRADLRAVLSEQNRYYRWRSASAATSCGPRLRLGRGRDAAVTPKRVRMDASTPSRRRRSALLGKDQVKLDEIRRHRSLGPARDMPVMGMCRAWIGCTLAVVVGRSGQPMRCQFL